VVLIIDHLVPEPDRDAGSRTMTDFMRVLVSAGMVVKFWPLNMHRTPAYTEALQDQGIEMFYGPGQVSLPEWLKLYGQEIDLVLVSRPDVADLCLPLLRGGTAAPIAYYGHDLHFSRMRQQADVAGDAALMRAAEAMRHREMAIWRAADIVLYPSEDEAAIVRDLVPSAVARAIVPYALTGTFCPSPAPDPRIVFVAGFGHPPNRDAAIWFVQDVLPLILARIPEARLSIVGSNPVAAVMALRGPHVELSANVTDTALQQVYAHARVAVVPLLAGAGVTHIFIGARGGPLRPEMFVGHAGYRLLYSNGAAWIFEVTGAHPAAVKQP
jgi:hypothetical protein